MHFTEHTPLYANRKNQKKARTTMNKVIEMGRLVRDPDIRYSQGAEQKAVARYTLTVDRRHANRQDPNAQTADFIPCVAFGKAAEFAEKYLRKGTKIAITGRIQTGSYVNKEGAKIYTTDVVVEEQEFAESKKAAGEGTSGAQTKEGFTSVDDFPEELPFQ
jgi:single-strand DNA-binding protein